MEYGLISVERFRQGTAVLLAGIAVGGTIAGCGSNSSGEGTPPGTSIPTTVETSPYSTEPNPSETNPPTSAPIPRNPNTTADCTPGLQPDSDGDGVPDACDTFNDQNNADTDGDGIPDSQDTYPNSYDNNNNGTADGSDHYYNPQSP